MMNKPAPRRSSPSRPGEKGSTFTIVKVESHPKLRNILHIALRDLKLRKPNGEFIEAPNILLSCAFP
jgi:hypothetical protein